MSKENAQARPILDYLYSAVMADTTALEDAKMTLEVIRKTDPGVYDEMIDDTISLIRRALSSSILGSIDKLAKENSLQREYIGLTDEEILEEYRQSYGDDGNLTDVYFAHAIEAKLKEKNGL